jgi:hypothetical protein
MRTDLLVQLFLPTSSLSILLPSFVTCLYFLPSPSQSIRLIARAYVPFCLTLLSTFDPFGYYKISSTNTRACYHHHSEGIEKPRSVTRPPTDLDGWTRRLAPDNDKRTLSLPMSASPRMSLSPNVGTAPLPVTPGQPNDAPGSEEPSYPSPPRWANNASSQPVASSPRPNQASYNSPQRSPQHAQQSLSPETAQSAQPDEEEEEDLDDLFGDEPAEGGAMSGVEDGAGAKRASSTDSEAEGSTKGSPRRR